MALFKFLDLCIENVGYVEQCYFSLTEMLLYFFINIFYIFFIFIFPIFILITILVIVWCFCHFFFFLLFFLCQYNNIILWISVLVILLHNALSATKKGFQVTFILIQVTCVMLSLMLYDSDMV